MPEPALLVREAAPGDFAALAAVLGPRGGAQDCWCMSWRLPASEQNANGPEGNRAELERRLDAGAPLGLLAWRDEEPVGWCSLSPRPDFGRIARSTSLDIRERERADIWSIACFMVAPSARRAGVMGALVAAAMESARASGARILEVYPPGEESSGRPSHSGSRRVLERLGFADFGEPRGTRIVMRRALD